MIWTQEIWDSGTKCSRWKLEDQVIMKGVGYGEQIGRHSSSQGILHRMAGGRENNKDFTGRGLRREQRKCCVLGDRVGGRVMEEVWSADCKDLWSLNLQPKPFYRHFIWPGVRVGGGRLSPFSFLIASSSFWLFPFQKWIVLQLVEFLRFNKMSLDVQSYGHY